MKVQRIYSNNAQYQKFEVLKTNRNKRFKYNEFLVEGVRNINEAIKNHWIIVSFIYSYEDKLSDWAKNHLDSVRTEINYELTKELMAGISGKEDTSELLAIARMREDDTKHIATGENPILAIFDRPSNKGNLGTIIRSCDALGVDGLVITGHSVDLYDPDVIASSMGSFFKVPVIRITENNTLVNWIEQLRDQYHALKVVGTTSHAEKSLFEIDLSGPVIFLIGNETVGLNNGLKELSDIMSTIPMDSNAAASSFNVSCATTVMFYEAIRQRSIKL
ncbi:MAG TPA: TrmH family RNA methyltransferase [Mobilitalea sp.]|nr:TrmH family RNA methyltransferase [Mobilitalea sp.]